MNKRLVVKIKRKLQQQASVLLALVIFFEISYPTQLLALTGGPSQPEVQSFEPVGTSDMVDVFSGDFNYNLPLLDVEGYPINISYHSGITTDQEASWVGLGWNINPGVINRNMRGLPDDFAGDQVTKELNVKPNKTWGVAANVGIELIGKDVKGNSIGLDLGKSYGFNFNNYTGPSISRGMSMNINASNAAGGKLSGGLGLNSSSDEGLTVQPSVSFGKAVSNKNNAETSLGLNIGTSFNSRGGLKELSINASVRVSQRSSDKNLKNDEKTSHLTGTGSVGGTFDFGQQTYTPKIDMSMKNFSMSGAFTLGGEVWGIHGKIGLSGFYSEQNLLTQTVNSPAYGYLYAEKGQDNDNALMDFNREKDGTFTENSPSLPLTNFTFDTYGVSGQGIGGSYRPFRSDIGYVYDVANYTTNDNDALTVEIGLGAYTHVGANITVIDVLSQSGKWKNENKAISSLVHTAKGDGSDFENVYFKEANEKSVDSDPTFYDRIGGDNAVRFDAAFGKFDHTLKEGFADGRGGTIPFSGPIKRKNREKKTQNISFLKYDEYSDFAIDDSYTSQLSSSAQSHHIAEVTTLGVDGSRYIYGLAAYNNEQKEITFSVGSTVISSHDNNSSLAGCESGIVSYSGSDNSLSNARGIDNYYSATSTPAYAHSYLLTSVLSPDYIDADGTRGPSDGDFGNYTKFKYQKLSDFKWRIPVESQKATYNEGLKSDFTDDKANILYGKKDLYYLDTVITKNYIAVFHKSYRADGYGVTSEDGGVSSSAKVMKLDSISLYSKRDLITPIKRVHFEYNYALCPNIPNNSTPGSGKLTLKKIYFTYKNSNQARLSPYVFDYHESNSTENPSYNIKAYDRWGNYKANTATTLGVRTTSGEDASSFIGSSPLPPSDYPYVEQNKTVADSCTSAWSLKEINLPSGGTIKVSYESDDYAYVQNRQAGQMFKIVNYNSASDGTAGSSTVDFSTGGGKFYFKTHNGISDIKKYINDSEFVYFRFLVNIRQTTKPHLEYVSGYGAVSAYGYDSGSGLGWIQFRDVNLKDNGSGTSVNPVVKAAINFGKLHLPKVVWDATSASISGKLNNSVVTALINSSFIKNIRDAILGPLEALYSKYNVGRSFVAGKSWIRLYNPDGHKLGGGSRVRKIEMIDNWKTMTGGGSNGDDSNYGQEYNYNLEDGTSSGVAAYEPQLGGDENSLRYPVFVNEKKLLVPDDESYVEGPFGESFYPSASVGYSRVTITNLQRANVTRHATGKVVHEFYTAKEFPTITNKTHVNFKRGKDGLLSIRSLLKINVRDYFAATQGFVIDVNDMHGKPKSQSVFQEGQSTPITSIEYKYKKDPYVQFGYKGRMLSKESFKLNNNCKVVEKNGNMIDRNVGLFFDMVGDFRESKTETKSTVIQLNLDMVPMYGLPFPLPGIWPSFAKDKKRFRSATLTKVIQRFGILEETVAKDLGSVVSTKNVAYDAETGGVLLTQTTTNYNDNVYTFKYPAWWYYDLMGPAYQNLGFEQSNVTITSGNATLASPYLFKEGDEVALKGSLPGNNLLAWVNSVSGKTVNFISKNGSLVPSDTYTLKIIRSGRKNNLTTDMATITSLSNPLNSLTSNAYQQVLQASAVEFDNKRKTHCDCITNSADIPFTINPYVLGTKGTWKPLKSYAYLTERSQSKTNNNTNIRKDGVFESYTPFYKLSAKKWQIDPSSWTYVSEVTEFNVFGEEIENKDALGRYSSATHGYNQTQALSVASNSQYKEQGFDGFEDYLFNPCIDDHFKIATNDTTKAESHTGLYSLKISSGSPKTFSKQIDYVCTPASSSPLTLGLYVGAYYYALASGGTAPYNFKWSIVYGAASSPAVYVSAPNTLLYWSYGPCRILITVTDAKGATAKVTATLP